MSVESPWAEAYALLEAYVNSGADAEDVEAFARELGSRLPPPRSPEEHAQAVFAIVRAIAESQPVLPKTGNPFTG